MEENPTQPAFPNEESPQSSSEPQPIIQPAAIPTVQPQIQAQPLVQPVQTFQQPAPVGSTNVRYAGFLIRLVAAFIDSFIIGIVQFGIGLIFGLGSVLSNAMLGEQGNLLSALTSSAGSLIGLVLFIAYYVFFTGWKGATPGKMIFGLKTVSTDYKDISYGVAFLRNIIGKIVSTIPFFLGYFWIIFDGKKQSWHDKIANTVVVYKDSLPQA